MTSTNQGASSGEGRKALQTLTATEAYFSGGHLL